MKRISSLFFVSIIVLVVIFHKAVFTFLAFWSIHAYSISNWGKPLEFEDLSFHDHQFIISRPHFEDGSFFAEQMVFKPHFNLWKRFLTIDIELDQPFFRLTASLSSQNEKGEKLFHQDVKWMEILSRIVVKRGTIAWGPAAPSQNYQLQFDLEANSQAGGVLKVYSAAENSIDHFLILKGSSSSEGLKIDCCCQNIECSPLFSLSKFLSFNFQSLEIASGFLHGNLKAIFSRGQRPYIEGELYVEQLAFSNHEGEIKLNGEIKQARLKLEKNETAYQWNDQLPTIIGQLDILQPAWVTYQSPTQGWKIRQIEGSLKIDNIETALISLNAEVGDAVYSSHWNLQGKANLNSQRSPNLDLSLICSSQSSSTGNFHLSLHQPDGCCKKAEVALKKVSHFEIDFLQKLFSICWPIFNEFKLTGGEVDALIEADVSREGIGEVRLKEFQAQDLCAWFKSGNAYCQFSQIRGYGKAHLRKVDFWESVNAGFHFEDGEVHFDEFISNLPLTNIQAHLLVQQGRLENSLVTLQFAGLKGNMDIEWSDLKQLLTFKLVGVVEDLAELLPNKIQESLREHFNHNEIMIQANLKRKDSEIELGGSLHIEREDADQMDLIHFGCELKKTIGSVQSKFVPNGWFYGRELPLDKFLSPFIFQNGLLKLSGEGEFKGSFNDQFVSIKYNAQNLKLENEHLCIEAQSLVSNGPGQFCGSHQIDLKTFSHNGNLSVCQASYHEKNSDLFFQDIQGLVIFQDQKICISPLEAYCEDVYLNGELELDYSDPAPGVFNLSILCPSFSGRISQIRQILSHLDNPSFLHQIPLEGEAVANEDGLDLHFDFVREDYQLDARIKGTVTDGSFPFEDANMSLKGIYMDFDYNHEKHLLEFKDIQGTLLVGKPLRLEEYFFSGNHIRYYQNGNSGFDLDLLIKDKDQELFRLVGHTGENDDGTRNFYLDHRLSHISCIHPEVWSCQFKEDFQIEHIEFGSHFDLNQFLSDLQRFRNTGLGFLPHFVIDKASQFLPIEGFGQVAFQYHPEKGCSFQVEGSHIKIGRFPEHYALLKGSCQDKKWMIDQFQWDDWKISAEFMHVGERLKIPFAGLSIGKTLLLGLEGEFMPSEAVLKTKLNFCEVDLGRLHDFEFFKSITDQWDPKGHLKASGEIEWYYSPSGASGTFKSSLVAEATEFSLGGIPLEGGNSKDQLKGSIILDNINKGENRIKLKLEDGVYRFRSIEYDLRGTELLFVGNNFEFSTSSYHEQCPFHIKVRSQFPSFGFGECSLSSHKELNPLAIKWKKTPDQGFAILSMQGVFSGCHFQLEQDLDMESNKNWHGLKGQVIVDFNEICPLLKQKFSDAIKKLKLGSQFSFSGKYWMNPELGYSLLESLYFNGILQSSEGIVKGYRFQNMQAELQYVPGRLDIQNFTVSDPALNAKVEKLIVFQDPKQEKWSFLAPNFNAKNIRISFLRDNENLYAHTSYKFRSLIVKRVELKDLSGDLEDISTWRGKGNVHFMNPSRKNLSQMIFAIPGEIILRLGLDPNVLNPVTGTIYFDLFGDRFYLTKFKDVFSAGRGSKFNIAQGPIPSWMDFEGNLSVQIRMKQYNLIFKLAELFTVSIQGNIKKPRYTLQKQPKAHSKAHGFPLFKNKKR